MNKKLYSIGTENNKRSWNRQIKPRLSSGVIGHKTIEINIEENDFCDILNKIESKAINRSQAQKDIVKALIGTDARYTEREHLKATATADNSFKLNRELTEQEVELIDKIKLFLLDKKNTKAQAFEFLIESHYSKELATFYINKATETEKPKVINPFL